jgi:pimeloyl-ACP methyl ester carboxylesterase
VTGPEPPHTEVAEPSLQFAARWGATGRFTRLAGPPGTQDTAVHWIEFDGGRAPDAGSPPIVFVHGLGGSHLNWALIGPQLAAGRRALAVDLHGFGLTPGTRATATVQANTALLDRFLRQVAGTPAVLAGNSMGGMISILQAHAHPETVAGLVLISPALPAARQRPDWAVTGRFIAYALPGLGELYLRTARSRTPPDRMVRQVMEMCFADPSRIDPAMLAAGIALATHRRTMPGCDESMLAAARSLLRVGAQRQHYEAMMATIDVPVMLIGGESDRLVPAASVRRAATLNPRWDSLVMAGVGHTAQLETPGPVTTTIGDWLDRHHLLAAH